jgi:hypothetical protein
VYVDILRVVELNNKRTINKRLTEQFSIRWVKVVVGRGMPLAGSGYCAHSRSSRRRCVSHFSLKKFCGRPDSVLQNPKVHGGRLG